MRTWHFSYSRSLDWDTLSSLCNELLQRRAGILAESGLPSGSLLRMVFFATSIVVRSVLVIMSLAYVSSLTTTEFCYIFKSLSNAHLCNYG
jgi:hypothetical protein